MWMMLGGMLACGDHASAPVASEVETTVGDTTLSMTTTSGADGPMVELADVVAVSADLVDDATELAVTIESPDTGCERYADWWEVLTVDGTLVYRRILNHSHVDEQPFTRSGGPIPLADDEIVLVRAHLHPDGYGGSAMRGSIAGGFSVDTEIPADFAADLATAPPLPEDCLY